MAEKRMLTRKVTDDDLFVGLSASAQALYLHLSMAADDDGFCKQVSTCMFRAHASISDLEALLSNRYIYQFENGVIVIRHWRMANALRKDRYTPTIFQAELAKLELDGAGAYEMVAKRLPDGCQMVANCLPQNRLDKNRLDNTPNGVRERKRKAFTPPTLEQLQEYAKEASLNIDCKKFFEYFNTPNPDTGLTWIDSKGNPVRNWKQKMLTWAGKREEQTAVRSRSRNTLLNYDEKGRAREDVTSVELDLDEL